MSKIKIYVISGILIFLALSEFIFLKLIPSNFDLNKYTPKILSILQNQYNIEAEINNVNLKTFADFSIELEADKLNVFSENKQILKANQTRFRFYLLPLLIGHLNIKTFTSKDLNVLIERDKQGLYNFKKIKLPKKFDLEISNANIDLTQYNINFADNFYKNSYTLKGDKIFINKFKQNKFIDLKIKGNLDVNAKDSYPINIDIKTKLPLDKHLEDRNLKLNISLKNFDLNILQNYIKEYFDKSLKILSGSIDIELKTQNDKSKNDINLYTNLNNLNYVRNAKEMSIISNGIYEINSNFSANNNILKIKHFNILGDGINVSANGTLKDFSSLKTIKTDLSVTMKDSKSDKMYWFLPSEIPTDYDMIRKVKKYGFFADVNGDLKIKGKGMTPDVFGKVDIINAYAVKPFASHVPKANIFLEFMGQYLNINNRSFTDKDEFVDVTGKIELYGKKNVDLHIVSTKNVDLIYTYQVIVPIHDVFEFELGPVPEMEFYKGYGSIDLLAKGNTKNPHLVGFFECHNTDTSLNGLSAILNNTSAKLDFLDEQYHFYTIDARENSYPINIDGNGDWTGKFDFDVTTKDLSAKEGLRILTESTIFNDLNKYTKILKDISGNIDAFINLKGQADVFTIENIKNNLKYNAKVITKNVEIKTDSPYTEINIINGETKVEENAFISNLTGKLNNAPFQLNVNSDLKNVKAKGNIKDFRPELLINIPNNKTSYNAEKTISAPSEINFEYSAPLDKIYYDKITADIKFKASDNQKKSAINIHHGNINIQNGDVAFNNLNITSYTSALNLDGKIKGIFTQKPIYDIKTFIKKFEIRDISSIIRIVPFQSNEILSASKILSLLSGNITGQVEYSKNKLNGNLALNSIIIKHPKISQSIVIGNTDIKISNNNAEITPFTFNFYKVPIFLKLKLDSITQNPKIYLYSTSKINSSFFDEFLNVYLTYPIKLKGETNFSTTIQGDLSSPEVFASLKIPQNSDISYMGASLSDTFDDREIYFNAVFAPDKINLKHLVYKKYIDSQHNRSKPLQLLGVNGILNKTDNNYVLTPLYIKTNSPINASLFNILFKKSIIKNGLVECNLKVSGKAQSPLVIGNLKASNVDMPSYNAKIRDLDVDLSQSVGDLRLRANAYDSELEINSLFKNSAQMPVEVYNLDINSKYTNLDNLFDNISKINYSDYSSKRDDINDVINNFILPVITIRQGTLAADNLLIKGLNAQNLNMHFSLGENMILNIDKFLFNIAQGTVEGNFSYNLKNTNINASAQASNVSAQPIVKALFMLDNQIYGDLNGKIDVKTSGYSDEQKMKNLNGDVSFEIVNGKMPKLGSLEYLLHASNLIENGITGMSINSLLQIFMPLRTGDFTKLKGSFKLKDGIAQNIQIYTRGKSLNLYITGNIDMISTLAKMEIWGKLDTNLKTPLGAIGNASLNSLFSLIPWINMDDPQNAQLIKNINKIPGVEISSKKIRIFRAIINGDINTEKFVEKFEWVKN